MQDARLNARAYTREHGEDAPEVGRLGLEFRHPPRRHPTNLRFDDTGADNA